MIFQLHYIRSFYANPAIMLADMREPMQCNPQIVHSAS
jgi:hypothetical protein